MITDGSDEVVDQFWFGIDFGNSFIKVSANAPECPFDSISEEKIIKLSNHFNSSIVCMMESNLTRFELIGYDDKADNEFIDFTIINIKRLIDNLSDENQMNEIEILGVVQTDNDDDKRFITQIVMENVKLRSRDDLENLNKLALIRIMDRKTNSSIEIPLFTVLLKLFEKLRRKIVQNNDSKLLLCNIATIPVFYNDLQNNFVKVAFEMAGFKVERTIRETVAAARAYDFESKTERDMLVLDCGATKTMLSLYHVDEGVYELLEFISDSSVSGNSIDEALVDYCELEFKKKTKKILDNQNARKRLREACKMAKEKLNSDSTPLNVSIHVDSLMDGVDFSIILSKPKFEQIITPTLSKIASLLNSFLESRTIHSINDLILCGASSQISKFTSVIREFFKSNQQFVVHDSIPPKTINARGAASFCELFRVEQSYWVNAVLSLSIGIEHERKMFILADRNTYLPFQKSFIIEKKVNPATNQYHFKLYMGERAIPSNNLFMGEVCIPNSQCDNTNIKQFKLDVIISENEILFLSIHDNLQEYHFQADWTHLTRELVEQSIQLGHLDKSS
ncbi:predicted protein [Naegleria gruberi]|uniref:Predicted protein n=1 Tax=Naegleria gruberi TaxID=5762 RepID=D2VPC2_NAEGR|nr:uncharacterized protein NAEGRDRAFT_70803 [Naegleria gruberi]EFC41330.1 predicted protein [Naegleria gruberi]|eukprot:XP_002674074.1 predicted protein [Naegleria gruberi strain NEG-M]